MDPTSEIVANFEKALINQSCKKPLALYSGGKYKQNTDKHIKSTYKPQDVISDLTKQLRAIQNADSISSGRKQLNTKNSKKSTFLPVNRLTKFDEAHEKPSTSKFETQCVSDTQLMDILENAEALASNTGVTQEFDTSFSHTDSQYLGVDYKDSIKQSNEDKNKTSNDLDVPIGAFMILNSIKSRHNSTDATSDVKLQNNSESNNIKVVQENYNKSIDKNELRNKKVTETDITPKEPLFPLIDISLKEPDPYKLMLKSNLTSIESEMKGIDCLDRKISDFETLSGDCTQILNEHTETEVNIDQNDELPCADPPSSPIFDVKCVKKTKTSPNLVFDLHAFEQFEIIARPLVEENLDYKTTKRLINSQILGKELSIQASVEPALSKTQVSGSEICIESEIGAIYPDLEHIMSPILVISGDKLRIDDTIKPLSPNQKNKSKESLNSNVLKDEILFSSDEDEEYIHKSYQDLPFTCALETSFYDQPDVLDKTMYVGFQTASNKSIQINSDSFIKAKSVLEHIKGPSLTDLVDNYDEGKENYVPIEVDEDSFKSTGDSAVKDIENSMFDTQFDITKEKINKSADSFKSKRNSDKFVKTNDGFSAVECKNSASINVNNESKTISSFNFEHKPLIKLMETFEFEGFKTANNKKITLSEIALKKSKDLFQNFDMTYKQSSQRIESDIPCSIAECLEKKDIESEILEIKDANIDELLIKEFENDDLCHENIVKNVDFMRFKTASNKKIVISDAALEKTKNILQDIDFASSDTIASINNKLNIIESLEQSHVGFRTASNKQIKLSKEAFTVTKNVFQGIDALETYIESNEDKEEHTLDLCNVPSTSNAFNMGFKTANNKEIKMSNEALMKSKNIFDHLNLDLNPDFVGGEKDSLSLTCAFKTASVKNDETSADAVAGSRKLIQHIISDDIDLLDTEQMPGKTNLFKNLNFQNEYQASSVNDKGLTEPVFKGFVTASRKPIKISAEAITKSKSVFQDIDEQLSNVDSNFIENENFQAVETDNNKVLQISEGVVRSNMICKPTVDTTVNNMGSGNIATGHFKDFGKANNDSVKISTDAMARNMNIIQSINNDQNYVCSNISEFGIATNKRDFQRFSRESISYKPETDSKLKSCQDASVNEQRFLGSKGFKGFQTASNKEVQISEQALAKSRNFFQDIDDNLNEEISTKKNSCFKGFQTASNKEVQISEEALAKSRKIFQDIDNNENEETLTNKNSGFKGFQTASNKKVQISEDAIFKSRNFFQDIDDNANEEISTKIDSGFKGFQTASKKEIQISEDALSKSRKLFLDIDIDVNEEISTKVDSCFKGFQTASNKEVQISEEALAKSRKIFQVIDNHLNEDISRKKDSSFKGFQTDSYMEVQTSEEALIKGFNEDDVGRPRTSLELQRASSENVKISKEDFAKNRKLLQDTGKGNLNENIDRTLNLECDVNKLDIKASQVFNCKTTDKIVRESNVAKDPLASEIKTNIEVNLENIINTQVINDFQEPLNTEDFCKTPVKSKRSGSPILSCPKAKRRKFETPYSKQIKVTKDPMKQPNVIEKTENIFEFDKNYKKLKNYNLKEVERLENHVAGVAKDIDPYILEFNFENLLKFEFYGHRNDINDLRLSTTHIKKHFLDAVNKKYVPEGWVENHLKLILWKLISYEVKFPNTLGVVCTAKNTLEQLKYRYDRELFNAERPALRKIMEKDDVPTKTLVLCVVGIFEDGVNVIKPTNPNNLELVVTDGWYTIKACVDKLLAQYIVSGKVTVGSKLATCGAELLNCSQGVAPWEDTSSIRLKLSGNSTRRARWYQRLGYQRCSTIPSRLATVSPAGGAIASLRVYITRVYPTLYVEKFDDGSTVTRSERLEHLHQTKYETERQTLLEKLYEEVEKELSDQDSQDSDIESGAKRRCLETSSQLAKLLSLNKRSGDLRNNLTESQTFQLEEHASRRRERLLKNIEKRVQEKMTARGLDISRNVVPLLKVRVADVEENKYGGVDVTKAMFSIWKPTDAVTEIIREGAWVEVFNVAPTAVRYSEIQISAGRQSRFKQSKYIENDKLKPYIRAMRRSCHPIKDLANRPAMTTDYNEIDTVGLIFLIDPPTKDFDSTKYQFQNVYLADFDKNIICVNFWGGLKKFGFDNVLDTGQIVACVNLQKRAGNTRKNIPQYRVTEFSFFTKTPRNVDVREMTDELNKELSKVDKKKFCEDCIHLRNNYSVIKFQGNTENISPYRFQNTDINLSKNKIFVDSPLTAKNNKIDDNLNLTGLDFESTFKQTDTQGLSPKMLLRKQQVNEKIAKLKMYGEPPPLSPIQILNKSKNAGNAYKSPLISKNDISNGVANQIKNLQNDEKNEVLPCSPIIMNRTYVKRTNVNPVKLDFSENVAIEDSDIIDHFAEDFDCSPPLSLD